MKPITVVTDTCLSKMKPHDLWKWEKWSTVICGVPVPKHNTWQYHLWIKARNNLKNRVNDELAKFLQAERLVCVRNEGLYIVDKKDVCDVTVDHHVSRFVGQMNGASKSLRSLSEAEKLSAEDKKTALRMGGMFELQCNAFIGTVARMKSLPAPMRKKLMKKFGIDLDGKQRKLS